MSLSRIDVPVYLDAKVALSLSASLSRGVAIERNVERTIARELNRSAKIGGGLGSVLSAEASDQRSRSSAVTESEVRKHTEESIFNAVRGALADAGHLATPTRSWSETNWQVGEFVEIKPRRIVVPLISAFSRLRAVAEAVAAASSEVSLDRLAKRVPQLLDVARQGGGDDAAVDAGLAAMTEVSEVAKAVVRVVAQLEEEAASSGLVDIVMFEHETTVPAVIAVASLDREYVDTKLLRRLGQGHFTVLGKVLRAPEDSTALNAFRNSMLGATNQLPVLLSGLAAKLLQLPLLLGDSVYVGEEDESSRLDFVGSASAISELQPLWLMPSLEVLPVAIYA